MENFATIIAKPSLLDVCGGLSYAYVITLAMNRKTIEQYS